MGNFIKGIREQINVVEKKREWLLKHGFQEEARILQVKIGGMFQVYDAFLKYNDEKAGL